MCCRLDPFLNFLENKNPLGKYRSYSGHCNNVMRPNWGAAKEPMRRLLPALYDDGELINFQNNVRDVQLHVREILTLVHFCTSL